MLKKQNIIIAGVAVAIIGSIIGYNYSFEQTRQVGEVFGVQLQMIQEDVKNLQTQFGSHITQWEEDDLTELEFGEFASSHFEKMEELIAKYDELKAPPTFESSVEIFKLSTQSQLQSDKEYLLWIQTGDDAHKIRSDALIQEAFEYETTALGQFNRAKMGINP